ncbi:MAG: DNA-binding response regulator [Cobetia sp.]|jgi:DNA-binding response OmpR family regulator|uniref:Response regulator transcription factor n=1 Tax=Cobetia amphilecti TaxID=1055104 RepID=A0AAP4U0F2_9GAMM|nr:MULTISPECIES: response regulator transcription factor [Cobetia]AVV34604.1 DNA-binding response regulator [Halomonas sp. SF2003]MBR9755803.1 response regulator transcription factor [Gammaproteobacteria bacterium]TCJ27083.1 response regulator transcription factor [Halomonas sp. GDM18]UTV86053.1 response regulator transcription factor [Cobetia litoralis]KGA02214.1 histidine kinase [Cobetia amphilecti]|tara:strand:- start:32276 stop:32992 length:717 start_codon:yes stop_codon:yes gene_type:complete
MQIGILEDDHDQRDYLTLCLEAQGHELAGFERASQLLRALRERSFDLLIIDWQLPDACGMELTRTLRSEHGWRGLILFITASQGEEDVVHALQHGADDFLAKPIRPAELTARVEALGRRFVTSDTNYLQPKVAISDQYRIEPDEHTIWCGEEPVALTQREYQLASLLLRHVGELYSRAYLLEMIWGVNGDISTRTVDTHVSRLRRKLGLNGSRGLRLKSVYQYGYRLESCATAPVKSS